MPFLLFFSDKYFKCMNKELSDNIFLYVMLLPNDSMALNQVRHWGDKHVGKNPLLKERVQ